MSAPDVFVHPSAQVEDGARIGQGTRVWGYAQIRAGAVVGARSILGRNAFIDGGVSLGANCKVQNNALIYAPATLGDGVFVGPAAVITNDVNPRAINADGTLKSGSDWDAPGVRIGHGASVGANATVVAGVTIGQWALIAAGAVVIADVPDHALVAGVPARRIGWVGHHGVRLVAEPDGGWRCPAEGTVYHESPGGLTAN